MILKFSHRIVNLNFIHGFFMGLSLDMQKIENQKGKMFRLSLNPDCDLEKMSTIQTNIEPIKMNI